MQRFLVLFGQLFLVLLVILTSLFFLLRLSGDPAAIIAGTGATPDTLEQIRENLGLNEPLHVQYLTFLWQTAQLDFGTSIRYNVPAIEVVLDRFPATLLLAGLTISISTIIAIPLGVITGVRYQSWDGKLVTILAGIAQSVPNFWLGIVLIIIFAVNLRLLPTFGSGEPRHLILPTATLAVFYIARQVRLVRSGMIEAMSQDYIRTAQAKGLPRRAVIIRHALRNTMIPIVTLITLDLSFLINGSVVVESLFSYNGIGRLLVDAINTRDYPIVQATVFFIAIVIVLLNLLADWLYRLVDPRIRHR